MAKQSAGILLYRSSDGGFEVLLVHPGGPFWMNKDMGSWSIPKGEYDEKEAPAVAARREFHEEMGFAAPDGAYTDLGEAKQSSGKVVRVFALGADIDIEKFNSNMFEIEWPPKSGKKQEFPEIDKAAWIPLGTARQKLVKGQVVFIERLMKQLKIDPNTLPANGTGGQTSLL